ncbi:MAG TPA: Gfo/Idh/MocA family oxidoreductase [Bryobacteraceae bacterium]|jgi:predicted dehydrogenase
MNKLRVAVIGAGSFGRHHVRVIKEIHDVELTAIVDPNIEGAHKNLEDVIGRIDAAIVATPTVTHESIATQLLASGIDVLVEKPVAETSEGAERLARLAQKNGRILQAGHLERFNPAVTALEKALTIPLFFEVHRLSVFTPRSLDIDVVLDLMIHDLDIVLSFVGTMPEEIRAAGISVLSSKVDIANVRLAFASGCIANLTASRISADQVRKLRLFQPGEYVSLDYQRQDAVRLAIRKNEAKIGFESLALSPAEPLALELAAFFGCVRDRTAPRVDAFQAAKALRVAESILAKIKEHAELVSKTIRSRSNFPAG